jgi:hypothetical protein
MILAAVMAYFIAAGADALGRAGAEAKDVADFTVSAIGATGTIFVGVVAAAIALHSNRQEQHRHRNQIRELARAKREQLTPRIVEAFGAARAASVYGTIGSSLIDLPADVGDEIVALPTAEERDINLYFRMWMLDLTGAISIWRDDHLGRFSRKLPPALEAQLRSRSTEVLMMAIRPIHAWKVDPTSWREAAKGNSFAQYQAVLDRVD